MAVIKDKKCMIIGAAPLASGAVFEVFIHGFDLSLCLFCISIPQIAPEFNTSPVRFTFPKRCKRLKKCNKYIKNQRIAQSRHCKQRRFVI